MIEKIPFAEATKFITKENKKKYPKLYAMIFHYYKLKLADESQYIIK